MLKPFFVWDNKILKRVDPTQVIALTTEGNYTKIHMADLKSYMVRATLSSALKKLPPGIFIKTHRAFAVSVFYIDNIARDHLLLGESVVPISKQHYGSFMAKLDIIK